MDDTDHNSGAAGAFMGWSRNTSAKVLQELAQKTSPGFKINSKILQLHPMQ